MDKNEHCLYQFGPFRLDAAQHLLFRGNERVLLTPKDFEILLLLINNSGHILEKERLLKEVWPDAFVEEGNLNRHISTIRKKLGEHHGRREYIETIPRRGYRFIAQVQNLAEAGNGSIGNSARQVCVDEATTRKKHIDSVAVLPFLNASADPGAEYLSGGITDTVINTLSGLPQLRVMAYSTVARYRGRDVDPQVVAREFGVRAVMIGRLLEFGKNLIVKVELVDAEDGAQLWGEQFVPHSSDILSVQEEISQRISHRLRLRLSDEQRPRLVTWYSENAVARQEYLMGRFLLEKRTPDGLTKSINHFKRAVELDPRFTLPYIGLTESYMYSGHYSLMSATDSVHQAKMALRALRLDSDLPEAHTAMAHIKRSEWDWPGMEAEYRYALKLSPDSAVVHKLYSVFLRQTGRLEESFTEIQKAQELDPISPNIIATAATNFYYARHYDRALEEILKVIELEPTMLCGHFVAGWIYTQQERYSEAIAAFNKAASLFQTGNPEITASLACIYALSGRTKKARQLLLQLLARSRREDVKSYNIALICAALGDHDQALAYLWRSYEERSMELAYAKVDPLLDGVRSDARFSDLLRRLGFTAYT